MFDIGSILEFMRVEPGHGFIQSVLLFMIWWQSKGLRQEMMGLKESLSETRTTSEKRFEKIEGRITVLENKGI